MKQYVLKINSVQAMILQRIAKEEIQHQREWKIEEKEEFGKSNGGRDYYSALMWDIIEQLCEKGVQEYWNPEVTHRTDEEQEEFDIYRLFKN